MPAKRGNSSQGKGIEPKRTQTPARSKSAEAGQKNTGNNTLFLHVLLIIIFGITALLGFYSGRRYLDPDDLEAIRWFTLKSTVTVNAASWIIAVVGIVILFRKRRQLSSGSINIISGSMAGGILGLFLIAAPLPDFPFLWQRRQWELRSLSP